MRRTIALTLLLAAGTAACTTTSGTEATRSLVKEIEGTTIDVNRAVADLSEALDQPYEDRAQLYERILDLRLPNTFAIALDKARRAEPPPTSSGQLDRYIEFLGELLLASEALDLAIANEDPTATAIAAVSVEVSVGALAVSLPPGSCRSLTPSMGRDLCETIDVTGYEADLDLELRRFVASLRPAFRVPDTFGDVIKGRVLATLQADATLVLQNTAARVGGLDPGTEYARLQQILAGYFSAAAEAWAEFAADPQGSDALIYGSITEALDQLRSTTQALLEAEHELILSALPNSQIDAITDVWFASPATDG